MCVCANVHAVFVEWTHFSACVMGSAPGFARGAAVSQVQGIADAMKTVPGPE